MGLICVVSVLTRTGKPVASTRNLEAALAWLSRAVKVLRSK